MTDKEEYFRNVLKSTIKNSVQTLLRTGEFSKRFLTRNDQKDIDKEIERISDEIITLFISKLGEKGYLENSSDPSESEFKNLLKSTIDEYFGEKSESGSK
jgi:hypothetical protein